MKKKKKKKKKKTTVFFSTVGYFMESDSPEWHSESEFYYPYEINENVTLKTWTIISNLKFEIENEIDENVNAENVDNFKF